MVHYVVMKLLYLPIVVARNHYCDNVVNRIVVELMTVSQIYKSLIPLSTAGNQNFAKLQVPYYKKYGLIRVKTVFSAVDHSVLKLCYEKIQYQCDEYVYSHCENATSVNDDHGSDKR